jgi:hypothetical protein
MALRCKTVDKRSVAAALALLLAGARVRAAPSEPRPLTVSLRECPTEPVAATAFLSAIELELDLDQRPIYSRTEASAAIAVRVDCSGRASIRVHVGGTRDRREFRVDDVPAVDRPRVLALAIAELVRNGAEDAANVPDRLDEPANAARLKESKKPSAPARSARSDDRARSRRPETPPDRGGKAARNAAAAQEPTSGDPSLEPRVDSALEDSLKPWVSASIHASLGAANAIYGGAAGIDWDRSRVQLEFGFAYAARARGDITSGLAAARYRHSMLLAGTGKLALKAALSSAAGVTWAIGDSRTPGVVVRRALFPYADARVALALKLRIAERMAPELDVYTGGAMGLLATNVGEDVLSSGGWLFGTSVGSTF